MVRRHRDLFDAQRDLTQTGDRHARSVTCGDRQQRCVGATQNNVTLPQFHTPRRIQIGQIGERIQRRFGGDIRAVAVNRITDANMRGPDLIAARRSKDPR